MGEQPVGEDRVNSQEYAPPQPGGNEGASPKVPKGEGANSTWAPETRRASSGTQVYQPAEATGSSRASTGDQLIAAAIEGPVERVLDLIGRGVDPNARDANGQLPLVMAVLGGDIDIVGTLAAAGADVNGTDAGGQDRTPLRHRSDGRRRAPDIGRESQRPRSPGSGTP